MGQAHVNRYDDSGPIVGMLVAIIALAILLLA